jgi:hypothetical protein
MVGRRASIEPRALTSCWSQRLPPALGLDSACAGGRGACFAVREMTVVAQPDPDVKGTGWRSLELSSAATVPVDGVLARLVSAPAGLSDEEAARRLTVVGRTRFAVTVLARSWCWYVSCATRC